MYRTCLRWVKEMNNSNSKINKKSWGLERLRAEVPPWSQHPAKTSSHKYCEIGDTYFFRLPCELTVVKWSKVLSVGASRSKSPSLLLIGIVLVEICLVCQAIPQNHVLKESRDFVVKALHRKSPSYYV